MNKGRKKEKVNFFKTMKGKIFIYGVLFVLLFIVLFVMAFVQVYNESNHFSDFKDMYNNEKEKQEEDTKQKELFKDKNFAYNYHLTYKLNGDIVQDYNGVLNETQEKGSVTLEGQVIDYFKESSQLYIKEENEKYVLKQVDLYGILDPYFLELTNIEKIKNIGTLEATTNFKDGKIEETYSVSLDKLDTIYSLKERGIIFIPEENISLKITYQDNIEKIELELTSLLKLLKDENISDFNLVLSYSKFGTVDNLVVNR